MKEEDKDSHAARMEAHRLLGIGESALEVSALGFGVMGMTYNRSRHPDRTAHCLTRAETLSGSFPHTGGRRGRRRRN